MKRMMALILALLLFASLCACGKEEVETPIITRGSYAQTVTTTPSVVTPGTTATTTQTQQQNQTTTSQNVPSQTTGTTTLPTIGTSEGNSETGNAIASLAISLIGTKFQNGGNGPATFDNPGFVQYCYKQNGYTVPRKAAQINQYGIEINPEEIQPGDILVFCSEDSEEASFVGIYIGNDQFVASTNPEAGTKIHKLNVTYWGPLFLSARRFQ